MPTQRFGPFTLGTRNDSERQSLPPEALWLAENVEFYRGLLKKRPGHKPLSSNTLAASCYFADEYIQNDNTLFLILACPSKIYYWKSSDNTYADKTPGGGFTGDADILADGVSWNNKFYFTGDSAEKVLAWDGGAGTFTALTNAIRCRYISALANHLVIANVDDGTRYPSKILWTDEGTEDTWVGGDSGENTLADPVGAIMGLWRIGDYIYIPREYSMHRMTFEGPPTTFNFEALPAKGCRAPKSFAFAITEGEPIVFYLSNDNVYMFNGIVCRPLPDYARKLLFDNLNPSRIKQCVGELWPDKGQYWLSFASGASNDNDTTFVWDYLNQRAWLWPVGFTILTRWQPRAYRSIDDLSGLVATINDLGDLGPTIDSLSGATGPTPDVYALGKTDKKIYLMDEFNQDAGAAIVATAETGLHDCDYKGPKDFKRVYLDCKRTVAGGTLQVKLGVSEDGENITWEDAQTHSLSNVEENWVDFRASGRFCAIQFKNATLDEPLDVISAGVEWEPRPER